MLSHLPVTENGKAEGRKPGLRFKFIRENAKSVREVDV